MAGDVFGRLASLLADLQPEKQAAVLYTVADLVERAMQPRPSFAVEKGVEPEKVDVQESLQRLVNRIRDEAAKVRLT